MKLPNPYKKPDKWKGWAIFFSIIALAGTGEMARMLTTNTPYVVNNRPTLIIVGITYLGVMAGIAIYFWRKSAATKRY